MILAALEAKEGMREHHKFGYLREYKQRKRRDLDNPNSGKYISGKYVSAITEYIKNRKEKETKEKKKQRLKVLN